MEKEPIIKELIPGIFLHKDQTPDSNNLDKNNCLWSIENKTMSNLEIEISFEDFYNTEFENNQNIFNSKIGPFETKKILNIYLKENWRYKTKFSINMSVPDKSIQKNFLKYDEMNTDQNLFEIKKNFSDIDLSLIPIEEVNKKLQDKKITYFVDPDFPPNDKNIISNKFISDNENLYDIIGYEIHWKHPKDFIKLNENDNNALKIINDSLPEPNDIVIQELLYDFNLVSAISGLAEKPDLINKIILNKEVSKFGIYFLKLCVKGKWKKFVIDDLIPCYPNSNPMFTCSTSNELWVVLIEKIFAKIYECYFNLAELDISDCFLLLTGCPTFYFLIEDFVRDDDKTYLFNKLNEYVKMNNYLVMAVRSLKDDEEENDNNDGMSISTPNFGYTILDIITTKDIPFIILRRVWYNQEKDEAVSSILETLKANYPDLQEILSNGKMAINLEDFVKEFTSISVCYTKDWNETRIKGQFIKDETNCISKYYYMFKGSGKMVISIYVDEDKFKGKDSRKQIMDVSLSLLEYLPDSNELKHVQSIDFFHTATLQMEVDLPEGIYFILPRSSGCFMGKTTDINTHRNVSLLDETNNLNKITVDIFKDIFNIYDLNNNDKLEFNEFKELYETMTKSDFSDIEYNYYLDIYNTYEGGISEKGLIKFLSEELKKFKEKKFLNWLHNLGYDDELYNNKIRNFMLSIHSEKEIKVDVKYNKDFPLNDSLNKILLKNNETKEFCNTNEYCYHLLKSSYDNIFTLGLQNKTNQELNFGISFKDLDGILLCNKSNNFVKTIKPFETEFITQFYAVNPEKVENIEFITNII